MTIPFNLQPDFAQVIDAAESVTLLRRGSSPGEAGTAIAHALRQVANTEETTFGNRSEIRKHADSDAHARATDVFWNLPVEELLAAPELGDAILDAAGCRWTILQVQQVVLGSRWKCYTRELAIAHGLGDTITVLKYLEAEQSWQVWRTGIRARIQPFIMQVDADHPEQSSETRYRVILEEDFPFDHTFRIRGPDGTEYRFLWASGSPRLGEMQVAEVVKC
jgi:hypothetical protein